MVELCFCVAHAALLAFTVEPCDLCCSPSEPWFCRLHGCSPSWLSHVYSLLAFTVELVAGLGAAMVPNRDSLTKAGPKVRYALKFVDATQRDVTHLRVSSPSARSGAHRERAPSPSHPQVLLAFRVEPCPCVLRLRVHRRKRVPNMVVFGHSKQPM